LAQDQTVASVSWLLTQRWFLLLRTSSAIPQYLVWLLEKPVNPA
jgi:hypothetical protein